MSKKCFYIFAILFCAISSIYIFTGKNFCHEIQVDLTCESEVKCNNTDLQLFYVLKGKNNAFAEDYSISKNIDTYQNVTTSSDFSIAHLRRKNKLTSIRLDLGNAADIQYAIDSFSVNGEEIISNDVHLHDAKLVSINNNKLVLATTGTDPFIYADVSVAPKIDYLCLLNLLQILILFSFAICVIKFRLWRILKNKYVNIFAPLVFFITLFVITNNYNYIVPSVLEWIFAVILLDMFVQ